MTGATFIDVRALPMPALDAIENDDLAMSIRLALASLRAATTYFGDQLAPVIDGVLRGEITLDSDSESIDEFRNLARNLITDIALAADHFGLDAEHLLHESAEIFRDEFPSRQPETPNADPIRPINEDTWSWVASNEPCSIPPRSQFDPGGRWEGRPILAFCFATDGRLTMLYAYPSLVSLTTDSSNCPEAPTYAIDLTAPPETARIPLHSSLNIGIPSNLTD